jgi:hypothetical protein
MYIAAISSTERTAQDGFVLLSSVSMMDLSPLQV